MLKWIREYDWHKFIENLLLFIIVVVNILGIIVSLIDLKVKFKFFNQLAIILLMNIKLQLLLKMEQQNVIIFWLFSTQIMNFAMLKQRNTFNQNKFQRIFILFIFENLLIIFSGAGTQVVSLLMMIVLLFLPIAYFSDMIPKKKQDFKSVKNIIQLVFYAVFCLQVQIQNIQQRERIVDAMVYYQMQQLYDLQTFKRQIFSMDIQINTLFGIIKFIFEQKEKNLPKSEIETNLYSRYNHLKKLTLNEYLTQKVKENDTYLHEEKCKLCSEPIIYMDFVELPCNHLYHLQCLDWNNQYFDFEACIYPMCAKEIEPNLIVKIESNNQV